MPSNIYRFYVLLILLECAFSFSLQAQSDLEREDRWVDSIMRQMTPDQKIGQIFMIRTYSRGNAAEEQIISEFIKKYYIGGICFFQGSPVVQVNLINKYQQMSSIPMFMGIDGEWGLGMRFPKESISFPKQLMLGAIQNNKLIYEMGREIARQCKRTGININFAPSVDINNNPSNPVIYDRSFGEMAQNVAAKGYMYMKGMEDEGIIACVKHFPGHGDTNVDSHEDLPVLNHNLDRLEETEFYPFRRLASQGVSALMIGHLQVPILDERPNRPTTLSSKVIKNIIREDMGYTGLLITDAMDMKGITRYFPNGYAEAEAFLAGNDIILLPENLEKAIKAIKDYLSSGQITEGRLNESVERILRAKYKIGLNVPKQHKISGLPKELLDNQSKAIKQKLTEAAITVLSDENNIIPIRRTDSLHLATLSVNTSRKTNFQERIDSYFNARHYQIMPNNISVESKQLIQTLSQFDIVIIGIHTSGRQNDFSREIPDSLLSFLKELHSKTKVIVVLFGSPYLLHHLSFSNSLILSYDNDAITQDVTAQSLFGVNAITGKLPVGVAGKWKAGYGIDKISQGTLGYALPEMVGMSSDSLQKIDSIMADMIKLKAAPGGQVLIAKDGKIIFQKSYGRLSQDGNIVSDQTIYDIASITKILATTLSVMKLSEENKLSIYNPLRNYIPGIDSTTKSNIIVADIMAHQARLLPWIGFYEKTTLDSKSLSYNPKYYRSILQDSFNIPVAKNMFMRTDYKDTIYQAIYNSKLRQWDNYKYSDLGFYLIQKVVEGQSGMSLDAYTKKHFYRPLGLKNTGFLPLQHHFAENIAPSEIDHYFRFQTLQGHVHDMGAAMLGGVAGHAGLFSSAEEMAVLMQMLLNKGHYGGRQFLKAETIDLFTKRHARSTRRGIGFDMKELDPSKPKSMSSLAPKTTFGHTGFTGTAAWADPTNNIVYIFCANRTYPNGNNQLFNKKDYRNKVQAVIYKSLLSNIGQPYL